MNVSMTLKKRQTTANMELNRNLSDEGKDPDGVVDGVGEETDEDVSLAVNLSGVDLIEDGHHDEGVEDHREGD